MEHHERDARLARAAEASGLDVWNWDAATRAIELSGPLAGVFDLETRTSLEQWIERLVFDDQDTATSWLLGLTRPQGGQPLVVQLDGGPSLRLIRVDAQGSHFLLAAQTLEPGVAAGHRTLQDFLYAVSHDLQEPLRMISSYVALIERRYGDHLPPEAGESMGFVTDGAARLEKMLRALLELSRIETRGNAFEDVALTHLLDEVQADLELAIEESGARITVDPLPTVQGDERQLFRLFFELLENAMAFRGQSPPTIHVAPGNGGRRHRIHVESNGIPIARSQVERIFRPFCRLQPRETHAGIGMGLTLCRRIAERHGGRIHLDPDADDVTRFVLELPYA